MAGITTAMTTSARQELLSGGHCFNATITATGSASSGAAAYSGMSSLAGVAVGMGISGTNVGSGSVVAQITGAATFTASVVTTGAISGGTLTFTGDAFKMALLTGTVTGTYGSTTTNYADITANSDEASGAGYTATGFALTNVTAVGSSGVGYITFGVNPSWTSASFTASGCVLYNTSTRNGGASGSNNTTGAGRALAVYSFGSTVTVSSGSLTILLPTASTTTALLRLS